jgi:diadenosine tetraphosphate (Ap4A) HIT family hydrolase
VRKAGSLPTIIDTNQATISPRCNGQVGKCGSWLEWTTPTLTTHAMESFEIYQSGFYTLSQAHGFRLPGYLILSSNTPVSRFSDLPLQADADLGACIRLADTLLHTLLAPERVYVLRFGESIEAIHFHIIPRTNEIALQFSAPDQVQPGLNGADIASWIWHNHDALGYSDMDIDSFIQRARQFVEETRSLN